MNFLSIDQHIAVSDIRYIFNNLGYTVTELSLSGHAPVIGKQQVQIDMLSGEQWGVTIRERKSKEFADRYGSYLNKFDGFICFYPPIFSMLYKYINKPVIIVMPIRYEDGAENNPELWEEFNDYLREGVACGRIHLVANSVYDKKYCENFLNTKANIDVKHIPSLCEYTGMSYNPTKELFLYYSDVIRKDDSGRMIKKHAALRAGHNWQCVSEFKGCIHFPYNASTMSTFEQYTANMPIFFPTKDHLLDLWRRKQHVLTQMSWMQHIPGAVPRSAIQGLSKLDPNNFSDEESISHWIDYADFYGEDMKYIRYFDNNSFHDMLSLSVDELMDISKQMRGHNIERKFKVYSAWEKLLKDI